MTTPLTKPVRRRLGKLVVEIAPAGLAIRGYGKKKWRRLTWQEVAAMAVHPAELIERPAGRKALAEIDAQPDETPTPVTRTPKAKK